MRWLIVLFILLLSGVAAAEPLVKPGERVWMIGDSNGYFLMHELPRLARADGVELRGNPVGGASLFWWTQRSHRKFIWQMNGFHPDVVLVVLGTNEAHFPAHVRRSLPPLFRQLHRFASRNGRRRVVWIGPPRLPERIRRGADFFRQMMYSENVEMLDSRMCVFRMMSDGIHPSVYGPNRGRLVWARWIWQELRAP
jgi:hypothetical protein